MTYMPHTVNTINKICVVEIEERLRYTFYTEYRNSKICTKLIFILLFRLIDHCASNVKFRTHLKILGILRIASNPFCILVDRVHYSFALHTQLFLNCSKKSNKYWHVFMNDVLYFVRICIIGIFLIH